MKLYLRVINYYRPFAANIFGALILLLITIGLNLLKPWPLKFLVDSILKKQGQEYFLPFNNHPLPLLSAIGLICASLVAIHLVWGVFNLINTYWLIDIGLKALLRLRTELYSYLQSLPFRFHDNRRSGDSTFRVAYDSQAIQTFFNRGFVTILGSLITLVGTFVIMYRINPKLTWIALAVIPFLLGAIFIFAHRIRSQTTTLQQQESNVLSRVSEGLASIRIVHAFTRESYEIAEFERECRESINANLGLSLTNVLSTLVVGFVIALGSAGMLYFGALEVVAGKLTIGDLLVFLAYLTMLYQPLEQLSYTAWALEGAAAGAQRCFEILDIENEVKDKPSAKDLEIKKPQIDFENVSFQYQPEKNILQNISFSVQPGETVAFVGGTGAGKTTILSLIPRFYDPTSGIIKIDGQNIQNITKKSLRQNIALVLQDTVLLNGSIHDNIAYGKLGATEKEIQDAAQAAQADEFINQLPQGYHTQVGERGVKLSGGQRQRIGIARAFLKNSPILLLDEPTSALDLQTESEIMGTLNSLMKKPTTIIVTHRLNTIHHVDFIYVLENGKIVESGKGNDLLKKQGLYWSLWNASPTIST